MSEGFDIGQACLNGHPITGGTQRFQNYKQTFCATCGEKTITDCPNCDEKIRGVEHDLLDTASWVPPAYCHKCGYAFPWTQQRIEAAVELIAEEAKLNEEETKQLEQNVSEVAKDTPRTELATVRLKRFKFVIQMRTSESPEFFRSTNSELSAAYIYITKPPRDFSASLS